MCKRDGPELVDCGQVSTGTHGLAFQILYENVTPPFNRYYLYWPGP
jgi:hypothetical protein